MWDVHGEIVRGEVVEFTIANLGAPEDSVLDGEVENLGVHDVDDVANQLMRLVVKFVEPIPFFKQVELDCGVVVI